MSPYGLLEVPPVRSGPASGGKVTLDGTLSLREVRGVGKVFDVFRPIRINDAQLVAAARQI